MHKNCSKKQLFEQVVKSIMCTISKNNIFRTAAFVSGRPILLLLLLIMGATAAHANDYFITTNYNNTTYFIGLNADGSALAAKTTIDETCIWTSYETNKNSTSNALGMDKNRSLYNKSKGKYLGMYLYREGLGVVFAYDYSDRRLELTTDYYSTYSNDYRQTSLCWMKSGDNVFAHVYVEGVAGAGNSNPTFAITYNGTKFSLGYNDDHDQQNLSGIVSKAYDITTPPVIKSRGANVTITHVNNGITILYTTDDTDPTTSPTAQTYAGTFQAPVSGTKVRAVAFYYGSVYSNEASGIIEFFGSSTVFLDDREDHSWSYYSNAESPIHSLNPADIEITYLGNGTGTVTDSNTENGLNPTSFSQNASGVQVSTENIEEEFVYYKTLERENNDGTGDLPYTTIPNPFSVRPTGNESQTRKVTLTWSCSGNLTGREDWEVGIFGGGSRTAQVAFVYINEAGNTITSANYSYNDSAKITVKAGTSITLKTKGASGIVLSRHPTITARYTDDGTSIGSHTSGSDNWETATTSIVTASVLDTYRGFYKWRVKSLSEGLAIKDQEDPSISYGVGSTIPADQKILFITDSPTGNEVKFEALWAQAYVARNNKTLSTYATGKNAYERNFQVVTSSNQTASNYQKSYPVTISSRYPDGTSAGGSLSAGDFSAAADTKVEYISIGTGSSNTWTANGKNLIIGRGVTGTVNTILGHSSAPSANQSYTIRLESGTYTNLYLGWKNNTACNYVISTKTVLGCDFDRATNTNDKLTVGYGGEIYGGQQMCISNANNQNNLTFDWLVKSGSFNDPANLGSGSGGDETFYLGSSQSNQNTLRYIGKRRIIVEGGLLAGISGAMNSQTGASYNSNGSYEASSYTVNDGAAVEIRVKGGTINGCIYGAATFAGASGDRKIVLTGGSVLGWIAGGANGTHTDGGELYGNTNIYCGGYAQVGDRNGGQHVGGNVTDDNHTYYGINGADGGNIFGAGCGINPTDQNYVPNQTFMTNTVGRVNNSTVTIADSAIVWRDIYGGGNYGYVRENGTSNIHILGGTVKGKVFGGSNNQQGQTVNITMKDGIVESGIYGGSNAWGTINNNVTIQVDGGQVGTSDATANIHGGGYGSETVVTGNVDLTLGQDGQSTDGVTVYGDVYGGSALGNVNGTSVDASKHTYVTLNKGIINGSLYGGALGDLAILGSGHNDVAANVYGGVRVTVNGGRVRPSDGTGNNGSGGVYGCNNLNGAPQDTVAVFIYNTDSHVIGGGIAGVWNVFGGGNHADYNPPSGRPDYPKVTMTGGLVSNSLYGGGNQADIKGNANVTIKGGTVRNRVFGGGNLGNVGTFTTTTSVTDVHGFDHSSHTGCIGKPESTSSWTLGGKCTVSISGGQVGDPNINEILDDYGYVFGASRGETVDPETDRDIDFKAYVKETEVTISGTAFITGAVYGGSENGRVKGDTWVKIQGGQIGCGEDVGAPYAENQFINPLTTTVDNNNALAECPHWNYESPWIPFDVYATADEITNNIAGYTGSDGHTFFGNVFGGGSGYFPYTYDDNGTEKHAWNPTAGMVEGNTLVEISGGHILTSVYGGNELTNVEGNCTVRMSGGTLGVPRTLEQIAAHPVTCYLFGAGKGDQRSKFDKMTNVNNTVVEISGGIIYGSIFGGSEDGHVLGDASISISNGGSYTVGGNTITTGPIIGTWGTSYVDGNVFGAGRGFSGKSLTSGGVCGNVTINIQGGTMLGSIYGGGRLGSVGTYLATTGEANYGVMQDGASHGYITINISGGTIGNTHEYTYSAGNRITTTLGGNVFTGCMGRETYLDGSLIPNRRELGKSKQTMLNISGGTIKSNVFGGGEFGVVTDNVTVNITGGTIGTPVRDGNNDIAYYVGGVYGGGAKTDTNTGNWDETENNGTGGWATGKTSASNTTTVNLHGGTIQGNVFGGGLGVKPVRNALDEQGHPAYVYGVVTVKLNENTNDNCVVKGALYGSNNYFGTPKGNVLVHVYATQGWTDDHGTTGDNSDDISHDVTEGKADDSIDKGTGVYELKAVYGGGNEAAFEPVENNVVPQVIIDGCDKTSIEYVYGGGNAASTPGTYVQMNGTYEIGHLFGGGNGADRKDDGSDNLGANVGYKEDGTTSYGNGEAIVEVWGGTVHEVFGGSNTLGNIREKSTVTIDESGNCPLSVSEVYGGGNQAQQDGETEIVLGCVPYIDAIYGGAKNANIINDINLTITSGKYGKVFGGNNIGGAIKGAIKVNVEQTGCLPIKIGQLYAGGNMAPYSVYGYDSNDEILESGSKQYHDPQINIISCDSIGNVFGGGLGITATMVGDPEINIDMVKGWVNGKYKDAPYDNAHNLTALGTIDTVFGGGNKAPLKGSTHVNIGTKSEVQVHNVSKAVYTAITTGSSARTDITDPGFAQSDDDAVTKDLTIQVEGVNITGNVYGGGNHAEVTQGTNIQIGPE